MVDRLLLVARSIFRISFWLQILLYTKIPRQTVLFCFNMGTMDLMFFKFYIQKINIIGIRLFNQWRDGGESIGQLILCSGRMSELDFMESFAQFLQILYVRYNLRVFLSPFSLNFMNQKNWVSNNKQLVNICIDGHIQTKNTRFGIQPCCLCS